MPFVFTMAPNPAAPGAEVVCRPQRTGDVFGPQAPGCAAVLRTYGKPDVALPITRWALDEVRVTLPAPLPGGPGGVVAIRHREATGLVESIAPLAYASGAPAATTPVAFTMSPAAVAPGELTSLDTVTDPLPGFGPGGTIRLTAGGRTDLLQPVGPVTDDRITVRVPADWPEGAAQVRFSRPDVAESSAPLTVARTALPVAFVAVPPVVRPGEQVLLDTVVDAAPGFAQPGASFRLEHPQRSVVLQPVTVSDDVVAVRVPPDWPLGPSLVRFSRANGPDSTAPLTARPAVLNLVLHELRCRQTEDWTGPDEINLELKLLGGTIERHRGFQLNDGQTKRFERTYPAVATGVPTGPLVTMRLTDEDLGHWPDHHDHLGEVVVPSQPVSRAEGRFDLDGADYRVVYSVTAT